MNKILFFLLAFTVNTALSAQHFPVPGQEYYIQNDYSGLYLNHAADGSVNQMNDPNLHTATWDVYKDGSDWLIRNVNSGKVISLHTSYPGVGGKKVTMDWSNQKTKWSFIEEGGKIRIKSTYKDLYLGVTDKKQSGTDVNQVLTAGPGSWWRFIPKDGGTASDDITNETNLPLETVNVDESGLISLTRVPGDYNEIANYSPLNLTGTGTWEGQQVYMNNSYEITLFKGNLELNGQPQGRSGKFLLISSSGTPSFNPGQPIYSEHTNTPRKRGYYLEKIHTEINIINKNAQFYSSLPETASQSGSTGFSEGWSVGASIEVGGKKGGPVEAKGSISASYERSKSSSLNWEDFSQTKSGQGAFKTSHNYNLKLINSHSGSNVYVDYTSMKNSSNLGLKPVHNLLASATNDFTIYEYYILEIDENAGQYLDLEFLSQMTVNKVTWTGAKIVQAPKMLSSLKKVRIDLTDVDDSSVNTNINPTNKIKIVNNNQFYTITNKGNFKSIAIDGQTNHQDPVLQQSNIGNGGKWQFEEHVSGYFRIKNKASGLYIANGNSTQEGAKLMQTNNPGPGALWMIVDDKDGFVKLENKRSGLFLSTNNSNQDKSQLVQKGNVGNDGLWKIN